MKKLLMIDPEHAIQKKRDYINWEEWKTIPSKRYIVQEVFRTGNPRTIQAEVNVFSVDQIMMGGSMSHVKIKFPEWKGQNVFQAIMWMNPQTVEHASEQSLNLLIEALERHQVTSITIMLERIQCMPIVVDYPTKGIIFILLEGLYPNLSFYQEDQALPYYIKNHLESL